MRLLICDDSEAVAEAAAERLAAAAAAQPDLVLALPTGRTVVPLYARLAAMHEEGRLDLSLARAFNLDEIAVAPDHPASFRSFMQRYGWERIGLDRARCDIPNALAEPDAECARYDRAIAGAGGFDLALLGLGADGHVAYNLPGPPIDGTHLVELPAAVAAAHGVPAHALPLRAITVGLGPLRRARRLLMLATSAEKARAVRHLVRGLADPSWPCTLLGDHPRFELLLSPSAAAEVS